MPTPRPDARRPAEVPPDATMPAADRPGGPAAPATPLSAHNVVPSALRAACGRGVLLFVGRSAAPAQQRAGRNARDLVVQTAEALGMPTSCVQVLGVAEPPAPRPSAPDPRAAIRAASVGVVIVPTLGRLSRTTDGLVL